MKTIDLSTSAPSLQELLHLATEGNLILRTSDGKEFFLGELDEFEEEVALVRQQPELMAFLEQRSAASQTYSLDEARTLLGLD